MLKNSIFHPFEMAICGFSNSGKTTLIEKIIQESQHRKINISIVKHDAHKFEMDYKGKDTHRFVSAGASHVLISNEKKFCLQGSNKLNTFAMKQILIDSDFVLVEGHKTSKLPKMVMADTEILKMLDQNELIEVKGLITKKLNEVSELEKKYSLPVFHRNDVNSILDFMIASFKVVKVKTLILAGGKSTRMGTDKGQLNYHGDFQTKSLAKLLSRYTDEVYVSVRTGQKDQKHLEGLKTIEDCYPSVGPSSGILSAMQFDSKCAWLVVAIDLPYLDEETIQQLLDQRNHFKLATCFENPERKWPEPLCTIWEPKSRLKLHQFMGINRNCPRKILFNSDIKLLELIHQNALDNCNTVDEFQKAKNILGRQV